MEKIILFLLFIGGSFLFDYVGKWLQKRKESSREDEQPAGSGPFAEFFRSFESPATPVTRRRVASRRPRVAMWPGFQSEAVEVEADTTNLEPEAEDSVKSSSFLPGETHPAISDMVVSDPLEIETLGEPVETPPMSQSSISDDETDPTGHYRRWRQAVIDSEILNPKYISRTS